MKNVIIKLNQVVKLLSYGDFLNKQELYQAFEGLKKIFNAPISSELFPKIIKELKDNLFYRQFKLHADPLFLTALARKVHNIETIEMLLLSSEINYSSAEELALKQRRNLLTLLALIKQDLQESKIPNQEDQYEDFYDIYFDDLGKLNEIFSADSISIENIQWFFESDLFEFISSAPDSFDVKVSDIYQILLENTEIKTKKDFFAHKQLLDQKENYSDYEKLYEVLSTTKKQLAEKLRNSPIISTPTPLPTTTRLSIFKKFSTLKKLSPTTREALYNNLKNF